MSEQASYTCFFCQQEFEYRPHGLDVPQFFPVRRIEAYQVDTCRACATDQLDGIAAGYERRLLQQLAKQGRPVPPRNEDGLLPMPFEWTSIFTSKETRKPSVAEKGN